MKMKITLATGLASIVLAWSAFGQDPSATPAAVATPAPPTPAASVTPVASATASVSANEDLQARIERKVKHGVSISLGPDRVERHVHHSNDDGDLGALVAIPIVA